MKYRTKPFEILFPEGVTEINWNRFDEHPILLWQHNWEDAPLGIAMVSDDRKTAELLFHNATIESVRIREALEKGAAFKLGAGGYWTEQIFHILEVSLQL